MTDATPITGWSLVRERARIADTVVAAIAVLLASSGLIPLFVDLSWMRPALVVIAIVALVGAAGRAIALPLPLVPLAEALGILIGLTAVFAGGSAWAHVVPTGTSWDVIRGLTSQGMVDAQTYKAPVDAYPGLVLIAVGAIGLLALAVDTLFVSVRSPMLAGIPLAAAYLGTSAMLPGRVPWWTFPLAAAGWLLLLAADQRDRVRTWAGLPATTRVRGMSGGARRIGLVAIAIAALVSVLVPAAARVPWGSGGPGDGTGEAAPADPAVILSPLVSMRRDLLQQSDTEVLTYRTAAREPSYLRVAVLEDFDGTVWHSRAGLDSGRDGGVPLPGDVLAARVATGSENRVTGGASYTYEISVTNLRNAYLPLPYPVSAIDDISGLGADWRLDPNTGMAFSDEVPASGLSYRVDALDPAINPAQLRGATAPTGDLWPRLQLPGGLDPRIKELALQVTAGATTPYDKALALQRWFTREGGFTYDTNVRSGSDADYIAEFLDARVGYCEQFAGAMAIMARMLGIPSRVAVGFTQGTQDGDGEWHVTARDAHAWPELWFDGIGWARFEPTPRAGATVQAPDYARAPDTTSIGSEAINRRTPRDLDTVASGPVDSGPSVPVAGIVTLLLAGALLWLARHAAVRRWRRWRRLRTADGRAAVLGAWAELGDLAIDLGQPWAEGSTPRQAAERLSRGMPDAPTAALRRLRQEVERVKYADPRGSAGTVTAERAEAVRSDLRMVTDELHDRVRWQTRVAAYCWPSSERRRQRSSMRSMKPGADGLGASAGASAGASMARAPKAE